MNKISRKGFLKIAAAAAMSGVTAGALAACNTASSSTAASGAAGTYIPGTYEGTAEGISSTVKVTMTFSDSAVTDVVVDTSGETASFGAAAADELREQLLSAGSAEIDGVSGSTITSDAVMKAAKSCYAQAKGEAVVSSVQLPTGDENDWLGKEPDIDEAAITETVDTDILIVGAGNGGMFAAAYAAANGLNFRVIEQNANVQDTRHWYGAIDSAAAKAAGEQPADRAKLLSEISRYASGKCDQRVVKTWINESAAMHDFMRSILEDKYGWVCDFTSGTEAAWPAENAEHNTDYLFPVEEHNYMASESQSGTPRNELLLQYIQELGYGVDFKTSLAKLEKESGAGRVVIEYNGMWLLQDLADALPENWLVYQCIATADGTTALTYARDNSMRSLLLDKIARSELIVFNRAEAVNNDEARQELHRLVRQASRKCDIAYEFKDGSVAYDDIPDPLPFDVNAPVIDIHDDDFGIWYMDCQDEPQKYTGKTVRFLAQVCQTNRAGKNSFVPGRFAMTCCVQDIQFVGFPCSYDGYKALEQRAWVRVTAKVGYKFHNIYRGKGPVLTAISVEPAEKPLNEVVTFS